MITPITRPRKRHRLPPRDLALSHLLCVLLCVLLCALAWAAPAHADGDGDSDAEGTADRTPLYATKAGSVVDVFTSVWREPFVSQRAWFYGMGLGSGYVGGQMARVLEGGLNSSMHLGLRMGFFSIESPFNFQTVQSSVLSDVTLMSWGARARLHLPLWGSSARLIAGIGAFKTWATTCEEGGEMPCTDPNEAKAFAEYEGLAWDLSGGAAIPLLSVWGDCNDCGCDASDCSTGGLEMLLILEYSRMWYDLQNDPLARTMHGYIDAFMVTLSFELMLVD